MIRAICKLSNLSHLSHPYRTLIVSSMSGIKLRSSKKSSSTVFAELSSEYLQKYNQDHVKDNKKGNTGKQGQKKSFINQKLRQQQTDGIEIDQLKSSWLGNALQDDLLVETKQWQGDAQIQLQNLIGQKSQSLKQVNQSQTGNQDAKKIFSHVKQNQNSQSAPLKVKSFKKQLSSTELINNSRKFMDIIGSIFPRYQAQRIIAEAKQFCSKRDLNMPSLVSMNTQKEGMSAHGKKTQQRKLQKQMKIIEKITKQREKKLFVGVRKIFDELLTDLNLIDNLLTLLSQSDPYIISQDTHKLVYSHEEGIFDDEANHHKAQINIILDKKQRQSLLSDKDQQKIIDDLIGVKKDFSKKAQQIKNQPVNKSKHLDEEEQEDLIDVFQDFSTSMEADIEKKQKNKQKQSQTEQQKKQFKMQKQQQRSYNKRQTAMRLIVKKNFKDLQKAIPQPFQINEQSLHQIERILFKNKKIIEDNVVFKKVKHKNMQVKKQKQRDEFGQNWVYGYDMPYALDHQSCQDFVDYLSKNYGDIIEYYIFPYKEMLQKKQNIMIHISNQKKIKAQMAAMELGINPKDIKPQVADKLLEKIEKEKNLKLNKSSMVFKFGSYEAKQSFLMPQMRLYGLNYKAFRNIRFQQAQSKRVVAISMIPWGCSSEDLQNAINHALKPIDVQVSYQACILAKGFIFIELDNFYECLNACQLLNNLQFQGQSLKVQINYGSSKLYGQKYKNVLEFDHYETLIQKLKDIKCFYNQVYQD